MQRNGYWIYSLLGFLVLYGLTFYPTIVLPYVYHDDFILWSYDPRKNYYGHPQFYLLAIIGRPIIGLLLSLEGYLIHTIQDASYLRLISVLLCALSATGLAFWLTKNKVDGKLAFLSAAGVFLAPGLQTLIIWSNTIPLVVAVFVSILAGLVLLKVKTPPEVASLLTKKNINLILLACSLLVTGLYTYQSSVMMFLVFPFARVLVACRETFMVAWKKLQLDMGVFVFSCVTYFVTQRFIFLPHYFARFPMAEEQMRMHAGYQVKLVELSQAPKKVSLFFKQLIPNALDFISYDFELSRIAVCLVLIVIIAGATALFVNGWRQAGSVGEQRRFALFYFLATGIVFVLFLMGNSPSLLSKGNLTYSRIYISNTAMIFLLFSWAIFLVAGFFRNDLQIKLSCMILGVVVVVLCFVARHNTARSAYLFSAEIKGLEMQIAPHIQENPRYHIIRARWSAGDFYTPSSFYWWDIPWIVRSIYVKYGKEKDFNASNVTSGTWVEPYEKAKNLVLVDATRITDRFHAPLPKSPPITLTLKDYFGFDVINIVYPTSPSQYYAVTTGEYDIEKKSCPQGGCSKVFAGATLESVTEWINSSGGESKVIASPGINGSFSPAMLMRNVTPLWFTPSPPKYPEWIRFDYDNPKVVAGFSMQSQRPLPNGEPVHKRMPRDFIFQGSLDGEQWNDLLKVQGAAFTRGDEWHEWDIDNSTAYKYYRLFITANNGHPSLIVINHLKLKIAGKSPLL